MKWQSWSCSLSAKSRHLSIALQVLATLRQKVITSSHYQFEIVSGSGDEKVSSAYWAPACPSSSQIIWWLLKLKQCIELQTDLAFSLICNIVKSLPDCWDEYLRWHWRCARIRGEPRWIAASQRKRPARFQSWAIWQDGMGLANFRSSLPHLNYYCMCDHL